MVIDLKYKVSLSIVLYRTDRIELKKLIDSIFTYTVVTLYLIDNSPLDNLRALTEHNPNIFYVYNPANSGFGAAHNIAMQKAIEAGSSYHFIINPDIAIREDVFTPMIQYIDQHPNVGMMMPNILNEDGSIQNLPKLLPNPLWIFRRKLKKIDPTGEQFINKYELRNMSKTAILNVPILSGCFTLLRLEAIREIGMYDEKFFMYFEDFDLSRRMHQKYKTIYFPEVAVYHGYEGGANKSAKLFKIFISSAIIYFNKWCWFFDEERKMINKKTLEQF